MRSKKFWQEVALIGGRILGQNCRVARVKKFCKKGRVCRPVEGSFVTECEEKDCDNFC